MIMSYMMPAVFGTSGWLNGCMIERVHDLISLVLGVKKSSDEGHIAAMKPTSAFGLLSSANCIFCALPEKIYLQLIATVGKVG